MKELAEELKQTALAEGFDAVGICRPGDIPQAADRLNSFLSSGWHGEMSWMERRKAWRGNPSRLWPEARSVIMLAESYTPDENPLDGLERRNAGMISVYARNRDYHQVMKKRLKRLGRWMLGRVPEAEIKVFVDTAPVMEKPLAEAAGVGWQGDRSLRKLSALP